MGRRKDRSRSHEGYRGNGAGETPFAPVGFVLAALLSTREIGQGR